MYRFFCDRPLLFVSPGKGGGMEKKMNQNRVRIKRNIAKRTGTVALAALTGLSLIQIPEGVRAAESETVHVSNQSTLLSAVEKASKDAANPTRIEIDANLTVSQMVTIPDGTYIKLSGDVSGRKIRASKTFAGTQLDPEGVIQVRGNLEVENLTIDGAGYSRAMSVYGGDLTLNEGAVVTGGKLYKQMYGGGIYAAKSQGTGASLASVTINEGASITGNIFDPGEKAVDAQGIGLYAQDAAVTMNGGSISDNIDEKEAVNIAKIASGGGVALSGAASVFTMNGGSISGNLAQGNGGAVYATNGGTFILNGGSVNNNTCYGNGAGIYLTSSGTGGGKAYIKGGTMDGNIANGPLRGGFVDNASIGNGGAICAESSNAIVEISGGVLTNNQAIATAVADTNDMDAGQGGAIYNAGILTVSGGTISSNSAVARKTDGNKTGNGGGIATAGGSTPGDTTINGGTITGNEASCHGADVYVNADRMSSSSMSTQGGVSFLLTETPGILKLEGKPVIGNLYLPGSATMNITGSIVDASVMIDAGHLTEGSLIAEGDGYRLMAADARALCDLNGKSIFDLKDSAIVVSKEKAYQDLSKASMAEVSDVVYSGQEITPKPELTLDGNVLTEDQDYQLVYASNIHAGEATVMAVGMGEYDGKVERTFKILPKDLSGEDVTLDEIPAQLSSENAVMPDVTLSYDGQTLVKDSDYQLTYRNNTGVGTAEVTIEGIGDFTGTKEASFMILDRTGEAVVSDAQALSDAVGTEASPVGTEEAPKTVYIDGAITLEQPLTIPKGSHIRLTGAGDDAALIGNVKTEYDWDVTGITDSTLLNRDGIYESSAVRVCGNLEISGLSVKTKGFSTGSKERQRLFRVEEGAALTIGKNALLTGGYGFKGSAIFNQGTLTVNGGTIKENKMQNVATGIGGAILNYGKNAVLTVNRGTFTANSTGKGGVIYNGNGASLTINGGTFSDNKVSGDSGTSVVISAEGGAVYNGTGSTAVVNGGTFRENTAVNVNSSGAYGGAIANYGTMTIADAQIINNVSDNAGGGIYSVGTTLLEGGLIKANTISNSGVSLENACGGGVFVASGTFTMRGGEITKNIVKNTYNSATSYAEMGHGGGVYVSNQKNGAAFVMEGGSITENQTQTYMTDATFGHGGGVYVAGGSGSLGGVSREPGSFTMRGGSIRKNSAKGLGDGVYIGNSFSADFETTSGSTYDGTITGAAAVTLASDADIQSNSKDNLYLTEGAAASVENTLSGTIHLTAQEGANAKVLECTDSYALTPNDVAAIVNDTGSRVPTLDADNNRIYLQAENIKDNYQIVLESEEFAYTGKNVQPPVKVVRKDDPSQVLKEGEDYIVEYDEITVYPDDYEITVEGQGEYAGSLTTEYTVTEADLSKIDLMVKLPNRNFTGSALTPVPDLGEISYGDLKLSRNKDFRVDDSSYKNNIYPGTASFTITGMGNYTGKRTVSFAIKYLQKFNLSKAAVSLAKTSYAYTGKAIKPGVTVKVGTMTLKAGTDYTVSYKNNTNKGTATVTVTGKGNFTGTKTSNFTITAMKATPTVKLLKTAFIYTGKAIKPAVKSVTVGGVILAKTSYTVSYKANTAVSKTAKVIVTLKGNYTGSKTINFTINKAAQPMAVKAAARATTYAKVKKAAQVLARPITFTKGAQGKVTYTRANNVPNILVNKTTGKITVKKGTKKKIYTVKIKVTAAGNKNYKAGSKTVTVKVTVK